MTTTAKKLIVDICHPAEVHHFRHLYKELAGQGWQILFVAKKKDVTEELLSIYKLPYVLFSESQTSILRKLAQIPHELWRFAAIVRQFRPSFILSNLSLHSSWISAFFPVVHVGFIDTEYRRLLDYVTLPFAHVKITPLSYYRRLGKNHFRYNGNHELAYLHPRRFQPDASVRHDLGLADDEPFVIVRFVAWKAFHDIGLPRMSESERIGLVREIIKYRRVFITSEAELPQELRPFLFPLAPHRILDALAFADLYVGEGITMASEAVTCGTPAVLLNSMRMGYCMDAEKYGILHSFSRFSPQALNKIVELLSLQHLRLAFQENHQRFMADKIDVTEFMAWFIECYPESVQALQNRKESGSHF